MNVKNLPLESRGVVKSALSLQIEQFELEDDAVTKSESCTLVSVENVADNKKIRPTDPQYIQAIAQMIIDDVGMTWNATLSICFRPNKRESVTFGVPISSSVAKRSW